MKNILFSLFFLVLLSSEILSQDEVLLTIENQPLLRSEFERIYHKNSNIAGYENKPVAEYLDMFINFKLKVLEAKNSGYDTVSSFVSELAGYREQLSKPYLQDRKLIDHLVKEAYDRTVREVNASHIMIKLPATPTPSDTLAALNKAISIRNRIMAGESFEKLARDESDDPSGKANGGKLGWFSAFTMVYPFENAAYNTAEGQYSQPVRSRYGYHIIKVNGFRDALGEVKLAHIMIRADQNESAGEVAENKEKVEACYKELQGGARFEDMVKKYSEDAGSVRNNGQMRWLRSGELPFEIEDQVFALKDSGTFTTPIQSSYGWHIFQLQGKREIPAFEKIKSQLEEKVFMDERGKRTEQSFNAHLKSEHGYLSYPENIASVARLMDSTVYDGNWYPSGADELIEPVFTINKRDYSQKNLVDFIVRTKRYNKRESFETIVQRKLDDMVAIELRNLEKSLLEKKYPAFKYLMEEYHDGILLFNIMDSRVWSKASNDSAGLMDYYQQHMSDYFWKERADISVYLLKTPSLKKVAIKLAKKRANAGWPSEEFVRLLCNDTVACVDVTDQKIEKDEQKPLGGFEWKKGFVKTIDQGSSIRILVVNKILPPAQKSFEETQGQVTADYQNYLDKQWTDSLRAKYNVKVDYEVLKLVK